MEMYAGSQEFTSRSEKAISPPRSPKGSIESPTESPIESPTFEGNELEDVNGVRASFTFQSKGLDYNESLRSFLKEQALFVTLIEDKASEEIKYLKTLFNDTDTNRLHG